MSDQISNLLVIANRYLGDTVLLTPLLWALHQRHPQATLWVWAEPPTEGILSTLGPWCRVVVSPRRNLPWWQAALRCRKVLPPGVSFDVAVVVKRSFSAALIGLFSGAKCRLGFSTQGRQWLLTKAVAYPNHGHEVDRLLSLLPLLDSSSPPNPAALYLPTPEPSPHLPGGPYIACHWRASNARKNWSDASILTFTQHLVRQYPTTPIVWLGGPQDCQAYEALAAQLPQNVQGQLHLKAGPDITLQDTMSLIAHARVIVGIDSFALHLAAAFGVPSVGLYGPTDDRQWAPWPWRVSLATGAVEQTPHTVLTVTRDRCDTRPCYLDKRCPCQGECMAISPDQVVAAVAAYWR